MKWLLIFIIILTSGSRFINLDADNPLPIFAHVNDEFYKSGGAIYKANFGTWINDDENSGVIHAPLFSAVQYPFYNLFDVSLTTTRLLSALGGILSVLLLYLILKKENKKVVAIFASFLLSINHVFFILNRIGLPESFSITVLLLSFYIISLNEKSRLNYLIAGFIMGLAFLLKTSFIYFIIAAIIFLFLQKITKRVGFIHLIYYAVGYSAILMGYFFYIKSFPPSILEPMIILTEALSLHYLFFPRLLIIFVDSVFKYPCIFLLSIATAAYFSFQRFPPLNIKRFKMYFEISSFSEKFAFSWLFGSIISVLFTSFIPRRIIPIIIPLVIYPSILLFKKDAIIASQKENKTVSFTSLFIPWLLTLSLFINYVISLNENAFAQLTQPFASKTPPNLLFVIKEFLQNKTFLFISIVFIISILGTIIFYKQYKTNEFIKQKIKKWSIFCLISLLTFGLVKFIYYSFIEPALSLSPTGLIPTALFFSYIIFKKLINNPPKFTRNVLLTYAVYCLAVIFLFTLIFPSFSVKEASQKVSELTDEGDYIIGYFSPGLSIESHTRPIFNKFLSPWKEFVNYSIYKKYKPVLYLTDPKDTYSPKKEEIPYKLRYITTFKLDPLMTFGKPRSVIELYGINYDQNYTETDNSSLFSPSNPSIIKLK